MITKQLSISEFRARCAEEIRGMEEGGTTIELTRNGKKIAMLQPVANHDAKLELASWIGSGKGTVCYGPNYDPAAPAWAPEDWKA